MEIRQLRYFVEVAEQKSFTRAAEKAGISQSALSQQLAGLEQELGVMLFDRTTRSVSITAAGQEFMLFVRRIITDINAAQECGKRK